MQVSIRPAIARDVTTIYTFICDLEEQTFDFELFENHYLQNIAEQRNIYLVAEDTVTPRLTGFISCHGQLLLHHLGMVYEIQEFFVDPDYRGQGIGQQLIRVLELHLRDRECVSLEVTSNTKRVATHEFYSRSGFTKSHLKFTKEW